VSHAPTSTHSMLRERMRFVHLIRANVRLGRLFGLWLIYTPVPSGRDGGQGDEPIDFRPLVPAAL
jgi:hypothetical protein